ncbi:He_PIG associated, NEW1 domain of glycohydrolase [Chitinophaga sp. CF118]|uniref:putative Ig domain-containing protein n=1 Tax=Chitinophaga sp. CF118 TaxID=1884367 RepID=UPI0008EB7AD5|nr:putative Ig domain-containing protein [Chitinophaga sp. CF118]SFD61656.1 He_PIG associated, NEW1 domain of glycohydrolase [Chitinophaga sp. CF118]
MWTKPWLIVITLAICLPSFAQHKNFIPLPVARFITGDQPAWSSMSFDDQSWKEIRTGKVWQEQGYDSYHGYAWYRIHIKIPSALRNKGFWKDSLRIFLAHVNDVDATYLNGVKIGQTGNFPDDKEGYVSKWPAVREYHVAVNSPAIHWDEENVIAIRDYDGGGSGGIFMGEPYIDMLEKTDGLTISMPADEIKYLSNGKATQPLMVSNGFNTSITGTLAYTVTDNHNDLIHRKIELQLAPYGRQSFILDLPNREGITCKYSFTEKSSGLQLQQQQTFPYILTPRVSDHPRINTAKVYGVKPGSPFLFKIAATGIKPLKYKIDQLPEGLLLDEQTGIITGQLNKKGNYATVIHVSNAIGTATQTFTIKVGDTLAFTPTMGWNSWNCWGINVSAAKVQSSAKAMLEKGLADHGWNYINVDDGWEAPARAADSSILTNSKFPDMQGLGNWLHLHGLKFGIYSSPGPLTCGGFLGSYQAEEKDARTYAGWGVDYLKYDWCSYESIVGKDTSLNAYIEPFRIMQHALRAQQRDIIYSICQYGLKDVWKWGGEVGGQSWRTTEDIEDTWESLEHIGFSQDKLQQYVSPGHWNDPDMMIVGKVGWGENLHPTRLTPDEQYTHVSLWCLLAAPLLIGCDLDKLDDFTLSLLTNDEVLAIDQDELGKQAKRISANVWVKELADGSRAVGIFNMDTTYRNITVNWKELGLNNYRQMRDVWRQQNIGPLQSSFTKQIAPHGVMLIKLIP